MLFRSLGDQGKQWPVRQDGSDTKILHTESFKRGLGKFHTWHYEESPELLANRADFPYIMTTGRILEHYNSGTMTRRTQNVSIINEDVLLVNPLDASEKSISEGDYVEVESARGKIVLRSSISDVIKKGTLYTTFHFPDTSLNILTGNVGDEHTLTPEYKVVAVRIRKSLYGRIRNVCSNGAERNFS